MSNKYAKMGWTKYEFPPDMISEEQAAKTMKLSSYQMSRMLEQKMNEKMVAANVKKDRVTEAEWKNMVVRMEKKKLAQRINEEFIIEFTKWLNGKSTYNAKTFEELYYDEKGLVISRKETSGCPWGSNPLTPVSGVKEFLDQGIDRRDKVIRYLAKLKMRGPTNIDECWMYYKYIIRQVGIDDYSVHEVESMAPYDYPYSSTGETGGPGTKPAPPYFKQQAYKWRREILTTLVETSPSKFAKWLNQGKGQMTTLPTYFGADIVDLLTNTYGHTAFTMGLGENPSQTGLTSEQARDRRTKEFQRLRNEARARNPRRRQGTSFMVVPGEDGSRAGGSGGDLGPDFMRTPDQRQQTRKRDRLREEAEATQEELEMEALGKKLEEEFAEIGGFSFETLSEEDKDWFLFNILSRGLSEIPVLVTGYMSYNTSPDGAPIMPPPPLMPDTHQTNALPNEQLKKIESAQKAQTKQLKDMKSFFEKEIGAFRDNGKDTKEMVKLLGSIERILGTDTQEKLTNIRERMEETFDVEGNGMGGPGQVNVNVPPIDISKLDTTLEKQGAILDTVADVLKTLKNDGLKIRAEDVPMADNVNPKDDGAGATPAFFDPEIKTMLEENRALLSRLAQNPFLSGQLPLKTEVTLNHPYQNTPGIQRVILVDENGNAVNGVVNPNAPSDYSGGAATINAGNVSSTGAVYGENIISSGQVAGQGITATGPVQGGDIVSSGKVTANGPVTASGNIISKGDVSVTGPTTIQTQGTTVSAQNDVVLQGNVTFDQPHFQMQFDPNSPITQNIKNEIATQNFVIEGNAVQIPAPILNVDKMQIVTNMQNIDRSFQQVTQNALSIADTAQKTMETMSAKYSELINDLKSASSEQTTRFNELVSKVEGLSTNQKQLAGAAIAGGPQLAGQISANMDVDVIKTGLVDDLKTLGITEQTIKDVVSGNTEVANTLRAISGQLPTQSYTNGVANTLMNISQGITQLKETMLSVNSSIEKNASTDLAFKEFMTKQFGKIGRVTRQDAVNMDLGDLENAKAVHKGYTDSVNYTNSLKATVEGLEAQKNTHMKSVSEIRNYISQMTASGQNDPRTVEQIQQGLAEIDRLTNAADTVARELSQQKMKYFEAQGALAGIGATILGKLGAENTEENAFKPDAVTGHLEHKIKTLDEKRLLAIQEEEIRLEQAATTLSQAYQDLRQNVPVDPAVVEEAIQTIKDVQSEEAERTNQPVLWSDRMMTTLKAAQNKPESYTPVVQEVARTIKQFGEHSEEQVGKKLEPQTLALASQLTGFTPETLERFHRYRGILGLSKDMRNWLKTNGGALYRDQPVVGMLGAPPPPAQQAAAAAAPQSMEEVTIEDVPVNEAADAQQGSRAAPDTTPAPINPDAIVNYHTAPSSYEPTPIVEEPLDNDEIAREFIKVATAPETPQIQREILAQVLNGGITSSVFDVRPDLAKEIWNLGQQAQKTTRLQLGDTGYRHVLGPIQEFLDRYHNLADSMDLKENNTQRDINAIQNQNAAMRVAMMTQQIFDGEGVSPDVMARLQDPMLPQREKLRVLFESSKEDPEQAANVYREATHILDELDKQKEAAARTEEYDPVFQINTTEPTFSTANRGQGPQTQQQENPINLLQVLQHLNEAFEKTSQPLLEKEAEAHNYLAFSMAVRDLAETIHKNQLYVNNAEAEAIKIAATMGMTIKAHQILEDNGLGATANKGTDSEKFIPSDKLLLNTGLFAMASNMKAFNSGSLRNTEIHKAAMNIDPNGVLNAIEKIKDATGENSLPGGRNTWNLIPKKYSDVPLEPMAKGGLLLELDAVTNGLFNHLEAMQRFDGETMADQYHRLGLNKPQQGDVFMKEIKQQKNLMKNYSLYSQQMGSVKGYETMITAEALVLTKLKRLDAEAMFRRPTEMQKVERAELDSTLRALRLQKREFFQKELGQDYLKYFAHSMKRVENLSRDMIEAYSALYESGIHDTNAMHQRDYNGMEEGIAAVSSLAATIDSPGTSEALKDYVSSHRQSESFSHISSMISESMKITSNKNIIGALRSFAMATRAERIAKTSQYSTKPVEQKITRQQQRERDFRATELMRKKAEFVQIIRYQKRMKNARQYHQ